MSCSWGSYHRKSSSNQLHTANIRRLWWVYICVCLEKCGTYIEDLQCRWPCRLHLWTLERRFYYHLIRGSVVALPRDVILLPGLVILHRDFGHLSGTLKQLGDALISCVEVEMKSTVDCTLAFTMPEKLISDASRQSLVTRKTRVTYIASVMWKDQWRVKARHYWWSTVTRIAETRL